MAIRHPETITTLRKTAQLATRQRTTGGRLAVMLSGVLVAAVLEVQAATAAQGADQSARPPAAPEDLQKSSERECGWLERVPGPSTH